MTIERLRSKGSYINGIVIALSFVFLLWRAKYGWCFDDEPFAVSLAMRLADGQMLITEEWHVAQLTGVLLLPFYKLFRIFSDTNDGILLTFRYIYCVLWFAVCFCVYRVFSRKNTGAIWAYLYLVLFSPLDYMTLSYTSLGLMSALLICCLYYRHFELKPMKAVPLGIMSSLLWCVLVLACPYMAAAYVLLHMGSLISTILKRRRGLNYDEVFVQSRLVDLVVTALIALAVCNFFIFRGKSFEDILFGLECMTHDPQHYPVDYVARLIEGVLEYDARSRFLWITAATSICFAPLIKKRPEIRLAAFGVLSMCYVVCMINYFMRFRFLNGQVEDIVFLGLAAYSLLCKKPDGLFRCFVPMSAVYAIAGVLGSNTGSKVLSMCLLPAGAAGILFIIALGREAVEDFNMARSRVLKVFPALICAAVMLTQFSCTLYIRLTRQYHETGMSTLTETIDCGACKGLVVGTDRKAEYESRYAELCALLSRAGADHETDSIMTPDFYPALYLDAKLPIAAFSSWNYGYGDELSERLAVYYERFSHMKPTLIYCVKEPEEELAEKWLVDYSTYSEGASVLYKKNS